MINKNKNIDCKIACDNLNLHPQSDAPNVWSKVSIPASNEKNAHVLFFVDINFVWEMINYFIYDV